MSKALPPGMASRRYRNRSSKRDFTVKFHGVRIAGTGSYVPARVLTNADLEKMVDTSDEWIQTRTGISERRLAAADEPTSALAFQAAQRALESSGIAAKDIDLLIVATLSPDCPFPNTACFVQNRIGAVNAACFSMEAACSGFLYASDLAATMIRAGRFRRALVIGAEKMSTYIDWTDRNTCVLFGDGAGAAVLEATTQAGDCFLASDLGADGSYAELLRVPAGGSAMPITAEVLEKRLNFIQMNGREVFKLAVNAMVNAAERVLERAGEKVENVRWLIPHQANDRIISAVGKRLNMPDERVFVNLGKYGNTSAATIPLALDEIVRGGLIKRGDLVLMVAFGGGLTWGSSLWRW